MNCTQIMLCEVFNSSWNCRFLTGLFKNIFILEIQNKKCLLIRPQKYHTVAINYAKYYNSLGVFSWYYFFKKWWLHARLWVRQEKNIYFVLYLYIFWVQLNISMKKKSMANFSLNRSFLEKSVFPQNWFELFILYINTRIIPLMLLKRVNLVSFAWYYPNKQNSKSSSEFDKLHDHQCYLGAFSVFQNKTFHDQRVVYSMAVNEYFY